MSKINNSDDALIAEYAQAKRILYAMMNTPSSPLNSPKGRVSWGLRVLKHGGPGGAKTAAMKEFVELYVLPDGSAQPLLILSPGACGDGFFGMIPAMGSALDASNGKTYAVWDFPPPRQIVETWQHSNGIGAVLVDDVAAAESPSIRAAMLDLFLEKKIGSYTLPDGVVIAAATNTIEEAGVGLDLPAAQANRVGHMVWPDIEPDLWERYMQGVMGSLLLQPIDVVAHRRTVLAEFSRLYSDELRIFSAYFRSRAGGLRNQPEASSPQAGRAWLSPRSAEFAVRARVGALANGLSTADADIAAGLFIGNAVMVEIANQRTELDLPATEDFLQSCMRKEYHFRHSRQRSDRTFALISGVTAYLAQTARTDLEKSVLYAKAFWTWAGETLLEDGSIDLVRAVSGTLLKVPVAPGKFVTLCDLSWSETRKVLLAVNESLAGL